MVPFAVFGGERISSLYKGELKEFPPKKFEQAIVEFELFRERFDYEIATHPRLAYVVVNNETTKLDLSLVDRWYERDAGEVFGNFTLYRVKIRKHE